MKSVLPVTTFCSVQSTAAISRYIAVFQNNIVFLCFIYYSDVFFTVYINRDRDMKDLAHASKHKNQTQNEFHQEQAQKNKQARTENVGKFRTQIQNERNSRLASVQNSVDQRMSRFGGMIVRKSTVVGSSSSAQNSSDGMDQKKESKTNVPQLYRTLTGHTARHNKGTVGSQINSTTFGGGSKKRGKKCTFADASKASSSMQSINNTGEASSSSGTSVNVLQASMKSNRIGGLGDEERRTNIVLANFLDEFLGTAFGELVFSMKNSWRRADASSAQHDLLFYSLTTACLQFQKFLHLDSQRTHMAAVDKGESSEPWTPDLKNITECFDRMMINHPADAIKKHFDGGAGVLGGFKNKSTGDIVVPMLLYRETISFLRIMLESEETAHNDLAMSAMYLIFYNPTTTERMDVLPALLKAWNPRSYSKAHMVALIELCHETLKLLGIAEAYVHHEQEVETKLSKKEIKALGEGNDVYFAASRMFDKGEYFQRLTTTTTVSMYTKALEFYRENSPQLNHYIFEYLKRMKEHIVESDRDYDDSFDNIEEGEAGVYNAAEMKRRMEARKLNLGHMLFNIETLNIFSVILNDYENNKNIEVSIIFYSPFSSLIISPLLVLLLCFAVLCCPFCSNWCS